MAGGFQKITGELWLSSGVQQIVKSCLGRLWQPTEKQETQRLPEIVSVVELTEHFFDLRHF